MSDYAYAGQGYIGPTSQRVQGATRSMVDPGLGMGANPNLGTYYPLGTPTVNDPTYGFGWGATPNPNSPIAGTPLMDQLEASDPYGIGLRAPGYSPVPGLTEQAKEFGLGMAATGMEGLSKFNELIGQNAKDIMMAQINQLGIGYGQEKGFLQKDYDIGMGKVDLRGQSLDVQKAANARQPGFLTALHNIAGQQYDLARQGNVAANRQGNFQLFNQGVGAGNILTGGYGVQRNELAQQLMRANVGVNLEQQGETARYGENMAKVADEGKQLDIQGRDLGLDRDQLRNELDKGMERLGLKNFMDTSDLLQKMNSQDLTTAMNAQDIWNKIIYASDVYAKGYQPTGSRGQPLPPP